MVTNGCKIFIKNSQTHKFLFFLRDDKSNIPNPNKWDLLGGGIEAGESPKQAIIREVKEETNIKIYGIELIFEREVMHVVEHKKYKIKSYIFKAYTNSSIEDIELYEGRKIDYFTLDDIQKENIAPTILDLFSKIKNKLA